MTDTDKRKQKKNLQTVFAMIVFNGVLRPGKKGCSCSDKEFQ